MLLKRPLRRRTRAAEEAAQFMFAGGAAAAGAAAGCALHKPSLPAISRRSAATELPTSTELAHSFTMPACSSCAEPDAPSLCGGCRFVAFCGPACQRAAWAGHKAVCKAVQADAAASPGGEDVKKTHCDGCAELLNGVNEVCVGCRSVSYCSARCYKAHWRAAHKVVCKGVGEARFARMMALTIKGDSCAMYNVGLYYENGTGVAKDEREMAAWYRRAAIAGHASAQHNLGYCFVNGKGVEEDAREAVEWYRRAAEAGHTGSQFNLGLCYEFGQGVEQDARAAVIWYRRAADAGNAKAQTNLGMCYDIGRGVEKDARVAVGWFLLAAEAGNADAQNNLGASYEDGEGVERDALAAVSWYRRAAKAGDVGACNNLGRCYESGIGVDISMRDAIKWYRRAAGAVGDPVGAPEARAALTRLGEAPQ
jgi:TPR repeat protein